MWRFPLQTVAFLLAVALLIGCGGKDPRASVTGKVTVAGKGPLPGGGITFVSAADGERRGSGLISADGTYRVADAPVGECKVLIDNSNLDPAAQKGGMDLPGAGAAPAMKGAPGGAGGGGKSGPTPETKAKMGAAPKDAAVGADMGKSETAGSKYLKISPEFSKSESTKLTATVVSGPNEFNFEVK